MGRDSPFAYRCSVFGTLDILQYYGYGRRFCSFCGYCARAYADGWLLYVVLCFESFKVNSTFDLFL